MLLKIIVNNMKHIKRFEKFNHQEEVPVKEGLWSRLFGGDKTKDAAHDSLRGQGYSHSGKDENNYIMFQGQKFYDADIEYDDYSSTKPIPRIEGGKLIISNPMWSN